MNQHFTSIISLGYPLVFFRSQNFVTLYPLCIAVKSGKGSGSLRLANSQEIES